VETSEVLLEGLGQLPDERDGAWLLRLTQLVTGTSGAELELARLYTDVSLDERTRFAAFYGYEILVRRKKDYSKFREILRRDGGQFAGRPMYLCISALADQLGSDQVSEIRLAVSKAERALVQMPTNFVIQNQVAEYVANLAERTPVPEQELLRALSLARDAAYASGYARYYQTLALAELACRNYQAAREAIGLAIDLEPSAGADYALRVGDYNVVRVKIDVAESIQEVRGLHANAVEELRLLRSDMIQLLGVLAAVIALISLSGQLAARVDFHDAAPLLATAAGAVLSVFGGLSYLVGGRVRQKERLIAMAMGLLLLVLPSIARAVFV
jgi:tetratricopeptide (TPR) repeat protein